MPPSGLTFLRDLTWPDVFEIWRENEEHLDHWKQLYTERGFSSWEDWRRPYAEAHGLSRKSWKLFRVEHPMITVQTFHGGPFRGWTERFYEGAPAPDFHTLAQHPDIQTHTGIREIMERFPSSTTITGVQNDDGIVIVEGMHRCAALALAAAEKRDIKSEVYIALADFEPGHLSIVGKRD